jgi:hypothetical protein
VIKKMPSATGGQYRRVTVSEPFRGDRKEATRHFFRLGMLIYLHPETSQIKVVTDRLNQQKYVM